MNRKQRRKIFKENAGKERMSSFVTRGNKLIAEGHGEEAMKLVAEGLQYYSDKIINVITPYSAADAGLLVMVLRHLANEVERNNAGAKELAEGLSKCVVFPTIEEIQKIQRPTRT